MQNALYDVQLWRRVQILAQIFVEICYNLSEISLNKKNVLNFFFTEGTAIYPTGCLRC